MKIKECEESKSTVTSRILNAIQQLKNLWTNAEF